jgi:tetratricopeptide (TPR) repeat protein
MLMRPGSASIPSILCAVLAVLGVAALPARSQEPAAGAADPAALQRELAASRLDPGRAVSLKNVKLAAGLATLHLEDGVLIPAVAGTLSPIELVFLGKGHIEMDAPDKVEAGQLELFTGAPRLDESFKEAVLVVGADADVAALLARPAAQPDAALRQRADALWEEWRKRREREILNIDRAILLDALQDPLADGYFSAWFRGDDRGEFAYCVEPDDLEQVWLGRFVPLDLNEKEKRQKEKEIRRRQRKGRSLGVEVDDLGDWDTWLSAALRGPSGQPVTGSPAFEPKRYALDVRLTQPGLRLSGKARVDLEPVVRGSRAVGFYLPRDFQVERVTDGEGRELFFQRREGDLTVILPQPPAAGTPVTVIVDYAGNPIAKDWNLTALLETGSWYPRAGLVDRATYDVTFHWPKEFDLVASGHRMEGGQEADGTRWERRTLGIASLGFSFELGHFEIQTARAGHVQVTFAFGSGSNLTGRGSRQEVVQTVGDALTYFEEIFGPYPLDEITVTTAPRGFSQGLLGFVTLSDGYLAGDLGVWNRYFGVEDRRLAIAHEVSHQWWGNLVGWTSYRDQWISEAMAEYSASRYGKNRLQGKLSGLEYSSGWQEELTNSLSNGRPLESLGPIVLGYRLDSSLADDAYRLIVYKKGALILNMLASLVGEEKFRLALRQVVQASAGTTISTQDLVARLEQATAAELDGFADQFVYGTGLPEILYSYSWERKGDGWVVKGQLRQMTPCYRRYKVERTGQGTFDVAAKTVPQMDVRRSALSIPIEIEVLDPAQDEGDGRDGANMVVAGNLLLKGGSSRFSVPVHFEPKGLWLDRKNSVFGFFFDESRYPKRAAYYRAREAADGGRLEEAEKLFAQALGMKEPAEEVETGKRNVQWGDIQWARRVLNARIEANRAVLLMDLGRDAEADAAIGRARWVVRDDLGLDRIEARLAIRRGRYEKAYQLLRRSDRYEVLEAQDYALLAVAARETGHPEEAAEALKKARERGVDMTVLTAAP